MKSSSPNYGIDAPDVLFRFLVIGVIGVGVAGVSFMFLKMGKYPWLGLFVAPLFCMGCSFLLTSGTMFWGSKIGKLRLRDKVLDALHWRGDEQVLDVGCGHGLMLIGAAKRLHGGKATGIDLWQREDQAGNSREATWQNVQLEGVTDRVELKDGDARKLPFADGMFDLVLSSWALHNIYDRNQRLGAVGEIVRVLKPGGRLALIDIRHTKEYAKALEQSQMLDIRRGWPSFIFVIPSFALTARKPN